MQEKLLQAYRPLIGKGGQFKGMFSETKGDTNTNELFERLDQSIFLILTTRLGERFFMPDFGSRLYSLLFENNTDIFQDLAEYYVREALDRWEPRITVTSVDVLPSDDNIVPIVVNFVLAKTNKSHSYVYPFNKGICDVGGVPYE